VKGAVKYRHLNSEKISNRTSKRLQRGHLYVKANNAVPLLKVLDRCHLVCITYETLSSLLFGFMFGSCTVAKLWL